MSKFTATMQTADTEQMTLPDIDQAKADVTAALDGAGNTPSRGSDNAGFNEAFGAITGLSAIIGVAQVIADVMQPQQPEQERSGTDFLTGKKKQSKYVSQQQAALLIRKADPVVRAARPPVSLMQMGKQPARMLGAKPAAPKAGKGGRHDLVERSNIASSSLKSGVKGAALSPEAVDRLKIQLGRLRRAEANVSLKAAENAPNDARVKNSITRFSQDKQVKIAPKAPEMQALKPPVAKMG